MKGSIECCLFFFLEIYVTRVSGFSGRSLSILHPTSPEEVMWNETGVDDKIITGTDQSVDISLALFQMHVTFIMQNESSSVFFPYSTMGVFSPSATLKDGLSSRHRNIFTITAVVQLILVELNLRKNALSYNYVFSVKN